MSVIDSKLMFSDGQAETTAAAHDSTNTIDLGAGYDEWEAAEIADYGESYKGLWIHAKVVTAFTSGGSATLTCAVQDSTDDSSFAAVSPAITTGAVAVATLVEGYTLLRIPLPRNLDRYVKLVYTIGTTTMTAGNIDAWIGQDVESR